MAEKDKERAAAERTQLKGAAAAGKQPQKPRAKTAYQVSKMSSEAVHRPGDIFRVLPVVAAMHSNDM